jgi:hypothetical protein
MTPSRAKIYRRFGLSGFVLFTILLAGCATMPVPIADLAEARTAVERAQAAGAERNAPVEYRFALDKLARAETAVAAKDARLATSLAQQSEADAELALARSRHAAARAEVQAKREENERLRRELLDEGEQ